MVVSSDDHLPHSSSYIWCNSFPRSLRCHHRHPLWGLCSGMLVVGSALLVIVLAGQQDQLCLQAPIDSVISSKEKKVFTKVEVFCSPKSTVHLVHCRNVVFPDGLQNLHSVFRLLILAGCRSHIRTCKCCLARSPGAVQRTHAGTQAFSNQSQCAVCIVVKVMFFNAQCS